MLKLYDFTYKVEFDLLRDRYVDVVDDNNFSAFMQVIDKLDDSEKKSISSISKFNCKRRGEEW